MAKDYAKKKIKEAENAVLEAAKVSNGELKQDLIKAEFELEKAECEIDDEENDDYK